MFTIFLIYRSKSIITLLRTISCFLMGINWLSLTCITDEQEHLGAEISTSAELATGDVFEQDISRKKTREGDLKKRRD